MPDTEGSQNTTPALNQQSYKSSPYNDQTWQVLGEPPGVQVFIPLEIEVLPGGGVPTDPMFEDYGGSMQQQAGRLVDNRWQVPDPAASGRRSQRSWEQTEEDEKLFSEADIQKMVAEAAENARKQALEESAAEYDSKISQIEQGLKGVIEDLHKQLVENIADVEKKALELTLAISEKLLHHAVDINPEYIAQIINEAISLCGSANISKIRVSQQDMEFIEVVGINQQLKQVEMTWQFEADSTIKAGCVIETSAGEVDYQLDKAFARVKENLIKVKK